MTLSDYHSRSRCRSRRRRPTCRPTGADDGQAPSIVVRRSECLVRRRDRRSRASALRIAPRQVTAIIGPSGCGKSTLIRCLNRMHEVTPGARAEGSVELNGVNIYGAGIDPVQVRRVVGMVFQKPNPFPMMTIYDNVVPGLLLQGGIARRASSRKWPSAPCARRRCGTKSRTSGRRPRAPRCRVANSSGCASPARWPFDPEVILMDEPCSALDPIATYRIEELIGQLKRDFTIAIVTHNMQQASRVSDYTAFMLAEEDRIGQLVEFGPTSTIFTNPSEKRTEDYITGRFG